MALAFDVPADLGHRRDADFAGWQAAEPDQQAPRWLGAERAGEVRQPDGDWYRLIVDDVVDPRCAVLESGDGRGRRVVRLFADSGFIPGIVQTIDTLCPSAALRRSQHGATISGEWLMGNRLAAW